MEPMGLYWNAERGEVRKRVPAGGTGGGITGQQDIAADPVEAAEWLKANPQGETAADVRAEPAPVAEPAPAADKGAEGG